MKFKKQKYIDPWVPKKFRWPGTNFKGVKEVPPKDSRKNQYAFHVGLLDKYSKNVPPVPQTLKATWGTSNAGLKNYFKDTRGAAV